MSKLKMMSSVRALARLRVRKMGVVLGTMLSAVAWIPQAEAVQVCDGINVPGPGSGGGCIGGAGGGGSCQGTSGNNVIICLAVDGCVMNGAGGNDILLAPFGIPFIAANLICGSTGGDLMAGGDSDDTLLGQDGNDVMVGGPAFPPTSFTTDFLDGGLGADIGIGDSPFFQADIDVGDTCVSVATRFSCN